MKEKQYLVKWEIDVEASSPEEASLMALEIQRDRTSEALAFTVEEQATGNETDINLLNITMNSIEGKDICYRCGCVQDYQTMRDVDETDFAIYCDNCHPVATAIKTLKEVEDSLDTNSIKTDWEDDEVAMEIDWLYGKIYKLRKILEKSE